MYLAITILRNRDDYFHSDELLFEITSYSREAYSPQIMKLYSKMQHKRGIIASEILMRPELLSSPKVRGEEFTKRIMRGLAMVKQPQVDSRIVLRNKIIGPRS